MAKSKGDTPKKGKASKGPAVPLRRSPRKATSSTKKIEADAVAAVRKVAKKTIPTKKKTTRATAPSPARVKLPVAKKSATPKVDAIASPRPRGRPRKVDTPEMTAKQTRALSATTLKSRSASPSKDGRTDSPEKTSPRKAAPKKASPKKAVPTASPSKATPNKATPRKAAPEKPTPKKSSPKKRAPRTVTPVDDVSTHQTDGSADRDLRFRQASLGGIRKSIEVSNAIKKKASPELVAKGPVKSPTKKSAKVRSRSASLSSRPNGVRGRSKSPAKTPTKTPAKTPAKAVRDNFARSSARTRARSASLPLTTSGARGRSKSPAKAAPRSPTKSPTKARGRSASVPSVTKRTSSRSKSPSKSAGRSPPKSASKARARSASVPSSVRRTRSRSKSPAKRLPADTSKTTRTERGRRFSAQSATDRTFSPSKSQSRTAAQSPARSVSKEPSEVTRRGRRPSPINTTSRRSSNNAVPSPPKSPKKTLARSASRTPSLTGSHSPLKVRKRKASSSPTEDKPPRTVRTRSASPSKPTATAPSRRSSNNPAQGPVRSRSKSPKKRSRPNSRPSSVDHAFLVRFEEAGDYGKALRRLEKLAYEFGIDGRVFDGHSTLVDGAHETKAKERGVERAEIQMSLNGLTDDRKSRTRKRSEDGTMHKTGQPSRRATGRRTSWYELNKGHANDHLPDVEMLEDKEEGCMVDDDRLASSTADQSIAATIDHTPKRSPTKRKASNDLASPSRTKNRSRSPAKRQASAGPASPNRKTSTTQSSGSRQPSRTTEDVTPLAAGQPSAPNRGPIHSVTNPEFIPDSKAVKKNPFFETMPGPEVWHRRMHRFFPFGETPYMEREMSRQINEDLARGNEQAPSKAGGGIFDSVKSGLSWLSGGSKASTADHNEQSYASPWALPRVPEAEVEEAAKDVQKIMASNSTSLTQKRKASDGNASSPSKRARRQSHGDEEFTMSGGLG